MAHQNEVPSFGDIRGSRPEDITQWVKLVGAGSSKCHGSNIHGNTPSNQCARSVLVSFTSVLRQFHCSIDVECTKSCCSDSFMFRRCPLQDAEMSINLKSGLPLILKQLSDISPEH